MLLVIGMTLYVAALVGVALFGLKHLFYAYRFVEAKSERKVQETLSAPKFKIELFAATILIPAILIFFAFSDAIVENKTENTDIITVLVFLIAVIISYAHLVFDRGESE